MSSRTFDDAQGKTDVARQGLLDNRCEHKPKRHRTLGRRKKLQAAKRERIKHENAVKLANFRKYKAKVRAYWSGDADEHPSRTP